MASDTTTRTIAASDDTASAPNGNGRAAVKEAPTTEVPAVDEELAVREAQESVARRRNRAEPDADLTVAEDWEVAPAPQPKAPRRRGPRPSEAESGPRRGRRVRRVIRRIDLWSVLKLAIVLYTCLYGAVLGTVALLWGVAYSSGQIDKLESFLADVGLENYRFYGDQMFRAVMAIGAIGVLAATLVIVLIVALVNVVSEITGGIRVIVIEEDPAPRR